MFNELLLPLTVIPAVPMGEEVMIPLFKMELLPAIKVLALIVVPPL
jgi:hypothetical protein